MSDVHVSRTGAGPGVRRVAVALLAVMALGLVGCSENNEVGGGIDTGKLGGGDGGPRLGETTTTAASPTTSAATAPPTTVRAATTTTARRVTTTTAPQVAIEIRITKAAPFFDPNQAIVPRNAVVRWVNTDDQTRSLRANDDSFASPPIPPGGKFEFRATQPGTFAYSDPDRPFATGQLQVR